MSVVDFNSIPLEVYVEIAEKLLPAVLPEDFEPAMHMCRKSGRDLKALMCVNRVFRDSCAFSMKKLLSTIAGVRAKRLGGLREEYCSLKVEDSTHPMLLDACVSGLHLFPIVNHEFQHPTYEFNDDTLEDIRLIVELDPSVVFCRTGFFYVHQDIAEVTPIIAAIANPNIPVEIVRLLLSIAGGIEESYRKFDGSIISLREVTGFNNEGLDDSKNFL